MSPSLYIPILCVVISLTVGLASGWAGALMGARISLARLETWRDSTEMWRVNVDGNINRLTVDVSAHRDDLLLHDMEIGQVMQQAGMERVRRQILR